MTPYASPAQLIIDLSELDMARAVVEEQEAGEAMGRAVGVCKVILLIVPKAFEVEVEVGGSVYAEKMSGMDHDSLRDHDSQDVRCCMPTYSPWEISPIVGWGRSPPFPPCFSSSSDFLCSNTCRDHTESNKSPLIVLYCDACRS